MQEEVTILIAEDDDGHATLIERNLRRAGLGNPIMRFADGQSALDFLFQTSAGAVRQSGHKYLLLLDIRMPKVDGVEVLRRMRGHEELKKITVIMLTTTDEPREVERCHSLGCSIYITKPVEYEQFIDGIRKLGLFLMVVQVPKINGSVRQG
jgi:CheY-like chemotaxis protein